METLRVKPCSLTQGQPVGLWKKARRKFSSMGGRAPGYRFPPDHFQMVKRMLAPDWAQIMLSSIAPNRRTASDFFSSVRTRRLPILVRFIHQIFAHKGNYPFDINRVHFKILSTRKLEHGNVCQGILTLGLTMREGDGCHSSRRFFRGFC